LTSTSTKPGACVREAVIHSADGDQHQTRDRRGGLPPDPDHHQGEGAAPQDRPTASWTDLGPEELSMKDTAATADDTGQVYEDEEGAVLLLLDSLDVIIAHTQVPAVLHDGHRY
jgi:hypothetical protein